VVCKLLLKVVCGSSVLLIDKFQVGQSVRLTSALINHFFEKPSMFCTAPDSLIYIFGICSRHTRSSIAAGGGFYNVQPRTAAWFYFVDEDKNFCLALFVSRNYG
jgi:hypothetical protein